MQTDNDTNSPNAFSKFFSGLKRTFSSDVVVRKTPAGLKIADINQVQKNLDQQFIDRYNRLHTSTGYNSYASTNRSASIAYNQQRTQLFRDYDLMDNDPILSAALDIYSDESTIKNVDGDLLNIWCKDVEVKEVLHNLFYDVLNLEFNLWGWIRNMCKYGDAFLVLKLAPEYGIFNVEPVSAYDMTRIEGGDPENPFEVKYHRDGVLSADYDNFQVAHFRLTGDNNFMPYGKSMLEGARFVWQQLSMMEDAMLIHRIMRAPEKRIFKFDVGSLAPQEVEGFMLKAIEKARKQPHIDPETGRLNMRFNLQNICEDFFLPVRGGDSGTEIDTLPGMQWEGIEDIEYLKNKMMAALKIPKSFLAYEEGVSGKSTLSTQDIRFGRTIERLQRIVVSELTKIAIIHLYSQGYRDSKMVDFSLELNNPSFIFEQEMLEIQRTKVELARDMMENNLFSTNYIYDEVFNIDVHDATRIRAEIIADKLQLHRLEKITSDGVDPVETPPEGDGGASDSESTDETLDEPAASDTSGEPPAEEPATDSGSEVAKEGIDYTKKDGTRVEYDHPDDSPFGRDPLGKDTRDKKRFKRKARKSDNISKITPENIESSLVELANFLKKKPAAIDKKTSILSENSLLDDNE